MAIACLSALGLSAAFVSTLIDNNFVYYWIPISRVLVLLLALAVIAGLIWAAKRSKLVSLLAKREALYLAGFFIGLVLLQLFIYKFIAIYQDGWDIETIFRAAGLSAEGRLTEGLRYYLTQFPNNFGVTLLMGSWFKLTAWTPVGWTVRALALNILFVNISILLVYLTVRKLRGVSAAIRTSWLALLFSPFFLYLPVFYTDTLSMPFAIGLFCAYVYLKAANTAARKYALAAVMGILAVFAFALKPTALCVLIAIVLYELLSAKKTRFTRRSVIQALKVPAIFLAVAAPAFLFFATARNMVMAADAEAVPWQDYVKMGAQGEGGFNREDRDWALALLDSGTGGREVGRLAWDKYMQRVSSFGPLGYANFLIHKLSYTWGDGTFYAPNKLERSPISAETGSGAKTWLQEIVLPEGRFFVPFLYAQNGFWLAVLIIFVVGAWRDIKALGKTEQGTALNLTHAKFILRLAILGVIIFFLIWETRSRYIVNYMPIFMLLLALDLSGFAKNVPKTFTCKKIKEKHENA